MTIRILTAAMIIAGAIVGAGGPAHAQGMQHGGDHGMSPGDRGGSDQPGGCMMQDGRGGRMMGQGGTMMDHGMHHGGTGSGQAMDCMMQGGMGGMGGMGGGSSNRRMGGGMMMNRGMMGGGMAGGGMMGSGMGGHGQMGSGMMGTTQSGMQTLFGSRVTPVMNLSVDDVHGYLDGQVKRLGNKRLKVGDVKAVDDGVVTADIVTVDNSLVQRLKVDRHSGAIDYGD